MEQNITPNTFTLQIDNGNIPYLAEAAKWAKFLAIIGFIFCALIILVALFAGTYMSTLLNQFEPQGTQVTSPITGTVLIIYYAVIALLYFFPCLYLFTYASKTQAAIRNNDQVYLNASFKNLKSFFKFWGILTVIGLCVAVIGILFAVVIGLGFGH